MLFTLPSPAEPAHAREWLIRLAQTIGPGFHPDTCAADYRSGDVRTFGAAEAEAVDSGLETVFRVLGDVAPYDIAFDEVRRMLAIA